MKMDAFSAEAMPYCLESFLRKRRVNKSRRYILIFLKKKAIPKVAAAIA
jgi:hypothetical protein